MKNKTDLKTWALEDLQQKYNELSKVKKIEGGFIDMFLLELAIEIDQREHCNGKDELDEVLKDIFKEKDEKDLLDELGVEEVFDFQIQGDKEEKYSIFLESAIIKRLELHRGVVLYHDDIVNVAHKIVTLDIPKYIHLIQ